MVFPKKSVGQDYCERYWSKEVLVGTIVFPLADEALISDTLAEELETAVGSFGRGLWRFRWGV
ncbi:MAG: hypothetical protein ACP5GI_01915 [Sulfolobales archaeon]